MAKAFDEKDLADVQQLSKAVGYSYEKLKPFRANRLELMRQYVGHHYSDNGATKDVPINLIELAMNIYLQRLVAQAPTVSITTEFKKLKEVVTRFEAAGQQLIKEIDLDNTLESAVVGGMFCKGIIKIGINLSKVEVGGVLHDSGQAFADAVSLDDWVEDMTVDNSENGQFEGNFYYPTVEEAKEMFSDYKGDFVPREQQQETEDKGHKISEGSTTTREEYRPTVKLLDLFLKKQNVVLRCLASDDNTKELIAEVLKVVKWEGPERGPYRKLGFSKVENNTIPLAPAMLWRDLHELANSLFRKLSRQAEREKHITGVQRGGEKDGQQVKDAGDGDMITLDNPKNVGEFKTGGISPQSLAFFMQVKDLFVYMGGNLDSLGGLGPQSETLGQDRLLSISASARIQSMQKKTVEFTKGVVQDLLFWVWNDPYTTFPATKRLKGYEDVVSIDAPLLPEDREEADDFLEYNIDIEPYSMQSQTPENKVQGLRTIFMEMLVPLIPVMQQQGITIDLQVFFKKIANLTNIEELNDILIYANNTNEQEPHGKMAEKAGQPPVTTRRYERVNRPGATNSGKSQILQQALSGGKPQESEVASLMKSTA